MADGRTWDLVGGTAKYVGASGRATILTANLTLPTNTQYAANDQVAGATASPTAIAFANAAMTQGGGGRIVSAVIVDNVNQSAKPSFKLRLYSGSPTLLNDNAEWLPSDASLAMLIPGGEIRFTSWTVGGTGAGSAGNCYSMGSAQAGGELNIPYRCGVATTTLYGDLVEGATYTPLYDQLTIRLGVVRD